MATYSKGDLLNYLAMKKTIPTLILFLFMASIALTQTSRPFTFILSPSSLDVPTSTTLTLPICFAYTGGTAGTFQPIAPDTYITIRFDTDFGTLNSVSSPYLIDFTRGSTPSDPVSSEDFSATAVPTVNKIIIEYEAETTKNLALRRQLCVDASWTSPSTPTQKVIELNESVIDVVHPTSYEHFISVH